jgi:hypothetical protein
LGRARRRRLSGWSRERRRMFAKQNASTGLLDANASIDRCSGCGADVSLLPPTAALSARPCLCTRCGSVYFARHGEGDESFCDMGIRPVSYAEVQRAINLNVEPSSNRIRRSHVERLVKCMSMKQYGGVDARREKRYPVAAPVTIVPLGPDFRVVGKPFRAMTTNISSGGSALIHAAPILDPFLALDFAVAGVKLSPAILEVLRVRQLAMASEVAGRLVCRILAD